MSREFDVGWDLAERRDPEGLQRLVAKWFGEIVSTRANAEFDAEVDRRVRPLYDWQEESDAG